jgi:hypothetical protein
VLGRHVEHRESGLARLASELVDLGLIDRARSAIRSSTGYASCSTKRATRLLSSLISGVSSGTTGATLRDDAARRGCPEHGFLERPRREAVAGPLARHSERRVGLDGHASEGEDDVVRCDVRCELRGEGVAQPALGVELVMVKDLHPAR